jgi:hypothetical protein
VLLFALRDGRATRLIVVTGVTGVAFVLISLSRDFVYMGTDLSVFELARVVLATPGADRTPLLTMVGGVLNRFYGAQDVVLASGYQITDQLHSITSFFAARPPNILFDLYGFTVPEGSGWGVAMGVAGWIVLLANHSMPILILLGIVLGLMLGGAEVVVRQFELLPPMFSGLAMPLAFFLTFDLVSGTLNWYYEVLAYAVLFVLMFPMARALMRIARLERIA